MQINSALVVYNKPLYELHILEQRHPHYMGLLKSKHPTTRNWRKIHETHQQTLQGVVQTLRLLGIKTDVLFRKKLKKIGPYDLVVTVGGDGTFLETSHYVLENQVLLGVNAAPFESTGALCQANVGNFLSILIDLITGAKVPKKVSRLEIKLQNKVLAYPALNEVLFSNLSPAGTSRYIIGVENKIDEHKSSGVWMSSATGSTAAIRSAGGKPLPTTQPGMQFVVRELFPETGKKNRILRGILPKNKKITLYSKMRQATLFIDGDRLVKPVLYGQKVEVSAKGPALRAVL